MSCIIENMYIRDKGYGNDWGRCKLCNNKIYEDKFEHHIMMHATFKILNAEIRNLNLNTETKELHIDIKEIKEIDNIKVLEYNTVYEGDTIYDNTRIRR